MTHHTADLRDLEFDLFEFLDSKHRFGTGPFEQVDTETARGILAEVRRLAEGPVACREAAVGRFGAGEPGMGGGRRSPGGPVSDPQGSDRIQQDIPTSSGTGANSDLASSFDDVPLTAEEAIERDAAQGDDLPARADGDIARATRAGASGEVGAPTERSGDDGR